MPIFPSTRKQSKIRNISKQFIQPPKNQISVKGTFFEILGAFFPN